MQSEPDIEALKIALADLEAKLAEPGPGKAWFEGASEHADRIADIRRRVAEIKRLIGIRGAQRTKAHRTKGKKRPAAASADAILIEQIKDASDRCRAPVGPPFGAVSAPRL
jgi:hypothetical protein